MNDGLYATKVSLQDYMKDFVDTLTNFCKKSPLQPTFVYSQDSGDIDIKYSVNGVEQNIPLLLNPLENKKDVIKGIKDILEKDYPVIYHKDIKNYSPDEIEDEINNGTPIKEALSLKHTKFAPKYKLMRVHHATNDVDCLDLDSNELIKFRLNIPLMSLLIAIGKDSRETISDMFFTNKKYLFTIKGSTKNERESK